ncbi:MAG: hypothetical protein SLRJCFUN_002619 [Candidatus Fervidibacter sp.]
MSGKKGREAHGKRWHGAARWQRTPRRKGSDGGSRSIGVAPLNAFLNAKEPLSGSRERGGDEMSQRVGQ